MTCCLDKDGDVLCDELPAFRMTYRKVHRPKCEDVWYSEMWILRNEGCVAICSRIAPNSGTCMRAADPALCKCADRWNVAAVLRDARRQKGCLTRTAPSDPVFNEQSSVTHEQIMKVQGKVEVYLHSFLTLVLDGGEWSMSHLGRLTPWKESRCQSIWRLGGGQRRYGCSGGEKISYPCVYCCFLL